MGFTQYANTIHNGTVLPYSLQPLLYHVSMGTLNLSEVIEIVAICAAMAAADPNGVLRQYDNKSSEITERSFQFDVHSGDKKRNQERYEEIGKVIDRCIYKFLHTRAGLE